ncbi:urease accessory protein UreF [Cellulomonas aerilata]|uniref:urease accessory protein UreF n=1 Tax=Cellulomonas aerilata TaxID=515326 RepID=UPI001FE49B59|nr:urease accessory UreF family protein [Cellulomonas aerilata]
MSQDVLLALLADARLPTGAHTQSAGLEPALRAGLHPDDVPAYLAARLRTVVRVESATAVVARHAVLRGLGASGVDTPAATAALRVVEGEWAARTPSAALRRSSEQLGRGYLRLARRLWAGHPALAALEAVPRGPVGHAAGGAGRTAPAGPAGAGRAGPPGSSGRGRRGPARPLVLGVTAACAGLDPIGVARLVALDDVQTVASAFLKLAPVDPLVTTGWVLAAAPAVDALARDVAHLTVAADLPAAGAPLTEEWAEAHVHATERLFSA